MVAGSEAVARRGPVVASGSELGSVSRVQGPAESGPGSVQVRLGSGQFWLMAGA